MESRFRFRNWDQMIDHRNCQARLFLLRHSLVLHSLFILVPLLLTRSTLSLSFNFCAWPFCPFPLIRSPAQFNSSHRPFPRGRVVCDVILSTASHARVVLSGGTRRYMQNLVKRLSKTTSHQTRMKALVSSADNSTTL